MALGAWLTSCAPAASTPPQGDCTADALVGWGLLLKVKLACRGVERASFAESRVLPYVTSDAPLGVDVSLPPEGLTYSVDLAQLAATEQDPDLALQAPGVVLAPLSTWLPVPRPRSEHVHVSLQISAMHSYSVSTGLHRSGDRYALRGNEVEVGTYAMFGRFDRERFTLPRHGGGLTEFEIATPRAEWASAPSERRTWVEQRARAVADFWHGSPTATVQLSLMPAPGRDTVLFGKVLPESAPGVMLLLGEAAPRAALDRDWVLVHELFHLGTPSFRDEGRWFDEGLATYFEPLIRVRAGLMSEDALWREYVRGLPLGLPALSGAGAEAATDSAGIYWGGAALCFLADLRVRRASGGRRGLEDGLRALLAAGGTANEVWRLDDAIAVIDRALGAPVLRELASRHARRGAPLSLRERFEDLGLGPRGERLRPSALRDALLRGGR